VGHLWKEVTRLIFSGQKEYMKEGSINMEIITGCLANKREAQREMYSLCLPYLSIIARRYLNEELELKDVLQDSFISIFQKLGQFDENRAGFKTWSTRIVINNCLKRNAKNAKQLTEELTPEHHGAPMAPEVFSKLNTEELTDWLKRMPAPLYAVFSLHVVDGFSHQEITGILEINTALSRQRLTRARKWLNKELVTTNVAVLRDDLRFKKRIMAVPLLLAIYTCFDQLGT
jgi:RNA polymerase sigma factor (sigma-70 family)